MHHCGTIDLVLLDHSLFSFSRIRKLAVAFSERIEEYARVGYNGGDYGSGA
jgi:hypothetical protein